MRGWSCSTRSMPRERGAQSLDAHRLHRRRGATTVSGRSRCGCSARAADDGPGARALVNAAGPWVDDVISRVDRAATPARSVRLVKGSHIVVPKFWEGRQAYLVQNTDKRVIFVNPYEDDLALIGTTDIPYEGRPEDVAADDSEIDYLLDVGQPLLQAAARRATISSTVSPACGRSMTTTPPTRPR